MWNGAIKLSRASVEQERQCHVKTRKREKRHRINYTTKCEGRPVFFEEREKKIVKYKPVRELS